MTRRTFIQIVTVTLGLRKVISVQPATFDTAAFSWANQTGQWAYEDTYFVDQVPNGGTLNITCNASGHFAL